VFIFSLIFRLLFDIDSCLNQILKILKRIPFIWIRRCHHNLWLLSHFSHRRHGCICWMTVSFRFHMPCFHSFFHNHNLFKAFFLQCMSLLSSNEYLSFLNWGWINDCMITISSCSGWMYWLSLVVIWLFSTNLLYSSWLIFKSSSSLNCLVIVQSISKLTVKSMWQLGLSSFEVASIELLGRSSISAVIEYCRSSWSIPFSNTLQHRRGSCWWFRAFWSICWSPSHW